MSTTTAPGGTATVPAGRLDGVDIARALAIVGMVTVHVGPYPVQEVSTAAWIYGSFAGKASLLFVLVAGVGGSLLADRRPLRQVQARMVYRLVWLLPLGLWLQSLDHPVAVILQYYALYFLLVAPFVARRDRTVLGWALALVPIGGALVLVTYVQVPEWVVPLRGDSPSSALDLVLFGYYPAVTWMAPMLFGLWLGRRDLTAPRVRARMVAGGAAALLVTTLVGQLLPELLGVTVADDRWSWVLTTEAHSQMPLWLVGGTGFAVALLGACLWLADALPLGTRPLADLGRLALSVYVGHLLLFHVTDELLVARDVGQGIAKVVTFAIVGALVSTLWLRVLPRGPLELVVRAGWQQVWRLVGRRLSPSPGDLLPGDPDQAG